MKKKLPKAIPQFARVDFEAIVTEDGTETKELISKKVPQNYAALTIEQQKAMADLFFSIRCKFPDHLVHQKELFFLMTLFRLPNTVFHSINKIALTSLFSLIKPFSQEPKCRVSFFKELQIGDIVLKGPENELLNFSGNQWAFAEIHFFKFLSTFDKSQLDLFCACLFPNRNFNGACVPLKKFNKKHYNEGVEIFNRTGTGRKDYLVDYDAHEQPIYKTKKTRYPQPLVSMETKQAILLNYMAMRNFVATKYDKVFQKKGGSTGKSFEWRGTFVGLAGPKFGNPEKTSEEQVHNLFVHMYQEIDRNEKLTKK